MFCMWLMLTWFMVYADAWPTREEVVNQQTLMHRSVDPMEPRVIKVTRCVYVATGYALGNSIMVIAPEGLIIVDTGDSYQAAENMLAEFRKISDKPIKAIVYTHNHQDHVGGAGAFFNDSGNSAEIWAFESLVEEAEKYFTYASTARYVRSMRQFGVFLSDSNITVDYGTANATFSMIYPTKTAKGKETKVSIAGLEMVIFHAVGETVDQIGIWIPQWELFMSGDNVYYAFPNMYTIRGDPVRDPVSWYKSIDHIIDLSPKHLVPSHAFPTSGKKRILNILVPYRDAIQYVHDQSVRFINKGLTPDEVVKRVKLPEPLASNPYLKEVYGMVEWCVKGVFQLYLGWFSGDPVDLFPLSKLEKAASMAILVGGKEILALKSKQEFLKGNLQWALELASYVLALDQTHEIAKQVKIDALNQIGDQQINSNARNYLKTSAMEEEGQLNITAMMGVNDDVIQVMDVRIIFGRMSNAYRPEVCEVEDVTLCIYFIDSRRFFYLQFRNSVLIVRENKKPTSCNEIVVITEQAFKDFVIAGMKMSHFKGIIKQNKKSVSYFKNLSVCFES